MESGTGDGLGEGLSEHANPLLRLFLVGSDLMHGRERAIHDYAFAVPDERALAAIARHAPHGVVELGAGTGYWAWQLHDRGVSVRAFDLAPPPSQDNEWFAGRRPWFLVEQGDVDVVAEHPERCLLIVWPTAHSTWPGDALGRFHSAGGQVVAFVGEGPGGRTGDDRFHAMLGEYDRCYHCYLGLHDTVCICDVPRLFEPVEQVDIPTWPEFDDRLVLYRRADRRPADRRRRGPSLPASSRR